MRRDEVSVAPPRGDKRGQVSICFVKSNAVIAIPGIEHRFLCVMWHLASLVKGRLCVVRLSSGVLVQGLQIYGATRFAGLFGTDHHFVTPGDRSAYGNGLNDAKTYVLVKPSFDSILPVDRDWDRGVVGDGLGVRVDHKAHGRARHLGEWLVFAHIESAGTVEIK